MVRLLVFLMVSMLPASAADVLWTGSGAVTAGNSLFGVTTGNKVDILVRYAPENKVIMQNYTLSNYSKRRIYHGPIKLRIEIRVGTRRWISYTETSTLLANLNPIDVFSFDPIIPPSPTAGSGDSIILNATTTNGAQFEHFNFAYFTPLLGITLRINDFAHPYDLLALGQFPGPSLSTAKISSFTGEVFANDPNTKFTFSITPSSIALGNYYPPLKMGIHPVAGGGFNLKFNSEAGLWYELQTSDNLTQWFPAGFHFGIGSPTQTIPAPPSPFGKRFYRLKRLAAAPF